MAVETRVRAEGNHWAVDLRNSAKDMCWMKFRNFKTKAAADKVAEVMVEAE